MQDELTIDQAILESSDTANKISSLASALRSTKRLNAGDIISSKTWCEAANTYTCQTIAVASCPSLTTRNIAVDLFYQAAVLPYQPWYADFQQGHAIPLKGHVNHQLTEGTFNVGLIAPRSYRQLASLIDIDSQSSCIILRSTSSELFTSDYPGRLAISLAPTGDLLFYENELLHWHHVCTNDGVNMPIPRRWERSLLNFLRTNNYDKAEQSTFRGEAKAWIEMIQDEEKLKLFYKEALGSNAGSSSELR